MLYVHTTIFVSICYIALLFALAHYGDRRAAAGRSITNNPYIYALSLAVFCTAWTFYGSVGRAVRSGPIFLSIYIGPTLMMTLGFSVMRKIMRISRLHRITSIADFIASRYGKSTLLGGVATVIAVIGLVPYISLQLKAISTSYQILSSTPEQLGRQVGKVPFFSDTAFYVAFLLTAFAVLFGTRRPEATERHEGLVAAIALESIVKLVAFLAIGLFVTFVLYSGFSDLFQPAVNYWRLAPMLVFETGNSTAFTDWGIYCFLSMLAFLLLPRQFQMAVIENVDEKHLHKAVWLFPLYMLAINIFVLPVAVAGMHYFGGRPVDPDTFVLSLPLANHQEKLALLVFIGGMSAATGMVIVETIALSTMICNDLVMPLLLHIPSLQLKHRSDLGSWLMAIRHGSIVVLILLGYLYFHLTAEHYTLVSIGLVSFTAVAQFAPALLGGLFWKGGTQKGALCSMLAGFAIWGYTMVLPSLTVAGILPQAFVEKGPFGIGWLKPFALFGLQDMDRVSHAVFWSLLVNTLTYVGVSLFSRQSVLEHTQATLFVDVFRLSRQNEELLMWRGTARIRDLTALLERFLGRERAEEAVSQYARTHDLDWRRAKNADAGLVTHVEKLLAGAIGSASARVMVASAAKEEPLGIQEVMDILDEQRQVIIYSRELEKVTAGLQAANEQLKELDQLKNDFISTVSHELRTPMTSIQSLAEILRDYPDTGRAEQKNFLEIMINEIHRLSRLINQVLDFQKIESGKMQWRSEPVDLAQVIENAVAATHQLISHKQMQITAELQRPVSKIMGDQDQLMQAMVNLISNAVKFCDPGSGRIHLSLAQDRRTLSVGVRDNGIGIRPEDHASIFEQFRQVRVDSDRGRPPGSGLGLSITKRIIEHHKGRIWVESELGKGAVFHIVLPILSELQNAQPPDFVPAVRRPAGDT